MEHKPPPKLPPLDTVPAPILKSEDVWCKSRPSPRPDFRTPNGGLSAEEQYRSIYMGAVPRGSVDRPRLTHADVQRDVAEAVAKDLAALRASVKAMFERITAIESSTDRLTKLESDIALLMGNRPVSE